MKNLINRQILLFFLLAFLVSSVSHCLAGTNLASCRQLTLLGTADLQGYLSPEKRTINFGGRYGETEVIGGISRIAGVIKKIQQKSNHPVVVLSAGDDLMGRFFHTFNGKATFDLLGLAGYDFFAPGNHEFDRGPGILGEALEHTAFTSICSDLTVQGTALENTCSPFVIKHFNDVTVGFFSLMTPEFPHVTSNGNVALSAPVFTVARQMVAKLRNLGADIVVAVTHTGARLDRQIAAQVQGIDIIFGGHSHEYFPKLANVSSTLIVNGGEKGAALVRLDIVLNNNKKIIPEQTAYSLIPITSALPVDKATADQLHHYTAQLPATVILGRTDVPWLLDKKTVRTRESTVADMVNDLIREKFKVDLVLINGGAFRGNNTYPPGVITDSMLRQIDSFENDVYLLKMKGKYIREVLEHSATNIGRGGFLQVAGIRIIINSVGLPQKITQKHNKWQVSQPGNRLLTIRVLNHNGRYVPLEPEKMYSLATISYLARTAGDKYFWFKRYGHDQVNTYTTLYSLMAEKLSRDKVLNPPSQDQRIQFAITTHSK